MKKKLTYILILFLLGQPMPGAAEPSFDPEAFLKEAFSGTPPDPDYIWLKGDLRLKIEKILSRRYDGFRIKFWRLGNKTAWVLDEVGKQKPIRAGILIVHNQLDHVHIISCEEKRGSKVQYDSFTDQYKGVSITTENQLNKDVDVISGATLSSNAVTKMVKMALLLDMRVTNSG